MTPERLFSSLVFDTVAHSAESVWQRASGIVFASIAWRRDGVGRALSGSGRGGVGGALLCGFADKILSKVGEGTFGRVLECWDRTLKRYCAIKVIRNVQKYRDASMMEIDALQRIAAADPQGRWHNVALQEWLDYRGHICMVFEKLGLSLYDFLRKNHYQPFSIELVREFGAQLLEVRTPTLASLPRTVPPTVSQPPPLSLRGFPSRKTISPTVTDVSVLNVRVVVLGVLRRTVFWA